MKRFILAALLVLMSFVTYYAAENYKPYKAPRRIPMGRTDRKDKR